MKHWTSMEMVLGVLALLTIAAIYPAPGFGEVPHQISYQGYLTDDIGNPLDGDYWMTFSIYDVSTGGTALWYETPHVTVTNGVYNVYLGLNPIGNAFPDGLFDGELWLGVAVGSDAEMVPRQLLTSTPFAKRAANSDDADTLDGMDSSSLDQSGHVVNYNNPHGVTAAQTGAVTLSDVTWDNLSNIPAGFADNVDDAGITSETDPTVADSVKDGVTWDELGNSIPSGFADGVDNVGISSETDPQVGSNTKNYVPKWTGSELVTGSIWDDGNVGIGLTGPNKKLYISKPSEDLEYVVKIDNPLAEVGKPWGVGILFSSGGDGSGSVSRERGKGALAYELTDTWNRGKFHFLQDNGSNTTNPTIEDSVLTIQNDGKVGIGTRYPKAKLEVTDLLRVQGSTWPTAGEGLELAYNSTLNKGYVQAYDRASQTWSDLYLGNGRVGIGDAYPENQLHVEGAGSNVGGTSGFDEVVARFRKVGSGHSAASIDSASGQDAILFLAENGQAFWDVRHDSDVSHSLNIRYHGGSGQNESILRILPDGITRVQVLEIAGGSDLAEPFHVNGPEKPEPGMVVSIDPNIQGQLRLSNEAYDRTVAGVISGANDLKPGMVMKAENNEITNGDHPVALTGRVWCWCDADHGTIIPGDLLTTSKTPGYAMKVQDHTKAQGAILGKAMSSLESGKGMVLTLVTLQ